MMRLFDDVEITGNLMSTDGPIPYREAKANFEKEYLIELLRWSDGNVKRAAQRARRDRKGLYILMNKHGIDPILFRKSR